MRTVYYNKPKKTIGPNLNRWDSRWGIGVFVSVRTVSGEQHVGTSDGTFKVRTVKRVAPNNRFDVNSLNSIKGLPWDLMGAQTQELPAERQLCPMPISSVPRPAVTGDDKTEVTNFKIMKADLGRHGYTEGCPGCDAARNTTTQRPHIQTCRGRARGLL